MSPSSTNSELKNFGFVRPPDEPLIYKFGGITGIIHEVRNTTRSWRKWQPSDESQRFIKFDDYGCVSHSGENICGIQMDFLHESELIRSEDWEWLKNPLPGSGLSFIDANGKFNADDRWIVVLSGTTPGIGNYPSRMWDAVRKYGLIPQGGTPFDPQWIESRYYSKADFPASSYEIGKEFLKRFTVQYEQVLPLTKAVFQKALEQAPVHIAVPTCSEWFSNNDTIHDCSLNANHMITLVEYEDYPYIVDSYNPFLKRLEDGYKIDFAYKAVLSPVHSVDPVKPPLPSGLRLERDLKRGDYLTDVAVLCKMLVADGCLSVSFSPTPHYSDEVQDGVFNFQVKHGLASIWDRVWFRGYYLRAKDRLILNGLYGK